MTDRELAARWDADHRLAARTALIAGAAAVVGTATFFSFGLAPIMAIQEGGTAGSFEITLVACLLLAVDLALLGFIVGLVHAFADADKGAHTVTKAELADALRAPEPLQSGRRHDQRIAAFHLALHLVGAALQVSTPLQSR